MYARFIEPSDKKKMGPMRQVVAGGAHGRVLELGAGTGANLEFYDWSKVDSLEMTEPDPFMMRYITPKVEALSPETRARVHTSDAPAEALPFADAEFDCAVVTLVLCSVADLEASLGELRRVLKPGGEMRLIEHVKGSGKTATLQKLVQPVYGWTSGDCKLSRETEAAIQAAGFDLEVTEHINTLGPLWPAFTGTAKKRA
jgi:ubiquinone/menaquinone biosynthesis C-methylase UbiE